IDLTGYWVAVVSEDWRHRMATSTKGDYESVPINAEGRRVADAWELDKDNAGGLQCKAFGIGGIMRQPGRLHITWQDDNTLRVETDYGMQTRLFHFGNWKPPGPATWQGDSIAMWEFTGPAVSGGAGNQGGDRTPARRFGNLKVTTTHMRPGYLRKNGIPYSANVRMTEYWDLFTDPSGGQRIMITQQVEDPEYLFRTWITTFNFKKEPDGSKWDPTVCSTRW
ncbi:MAG TPA: hypothetical protein VER98_14205, partial [Terriglobia bacterium]|nr:hypothetical protein [Terriglobia bacterium]